MGTLPDQSNPSSLVGKRQFDGQELLNATPVVRAVNEVAKIPYPRTLTLLQQGNYPFPGFNIGLEEKTLFLRWNKAIYDQGTESSNSGAGVPIPLLAKDSETEYDRFSVSAPSDRDLPITFSYTLLLAWPEPEETVPLGSEATIVGLCVAGPSKGLTYAGGFSGQYGAYETTDRDGVLEINCHQSLVIEQNSTYEFGIWVLSSIPNAYISSSSFYGIGGEEGSFSFNDALLGNEENGTMFAQAFGFSNGAVATRIHPNSSINQFSITTY